MWTLEGGEQFVYVKYQGQIIGRFSDPGRNMVRRQLQAELALLVMNLGQLNFQPSRTQQTEPLSGFQTDGQAVVLLTSGAEHERTE